MPQTSNPSQPKPKPRSFSIMPELEKESDSRPQTSKLSQPDAPYEAILTEYYPVDRYATWSDGLQIYAKDSEGNDYPLIKDGKPIYAVGKVSIEGADHLVELIMFSKNGDNLYIHNEDGILYPMDLTAGRPVFPMDENLNEQYITDDTVTEPHYPIDREGKAYYARDAQKNEIPIRTRNGWIYAKGKDNVQMYPKKSNGDEFAVINDKNVEYYAKDNEGNEIYPKKANGKEFAVLNKDHHEYYAKDNEDNEIYPKKADGDEFYIERDHVEIGAHYYDGDPYYAKHVDGDEYYPKKPIALD